jgi:hypothetical protein
MKRLILAVAAAASFPAIALVRGTNDQGREFVSGGVTPDEVATIAGEKSRYPLSILTAAQGSGAYLSDVHVRITDGRSQPVLDTVMDGPWLLVDLPPGRYLVEASTDEADAKRSTIALRAGEHRQAAFYFDTHDDVEAPSAASDQASDDADRATGVTEGAPTESDPESVAGVPRQGEQPSEPQSK